MTLPDVVVTVGDDLPTRSIPSDTGTALVTGLADRGPVNVPVLIRSLAQYVATLGPRVSYGTLYDTLDVAFRRGLDHAYVVRCVGPAAVIASKSLKAGEDNTLEVTATSPGDWANAIDIETSAGVTGGTFHVAVSYEDVLVEKSPELATNADAVAWAATSSAYIRLKDLGKGDPSAQTVALASGADDRANVDATVIGAALDLFTPDLGTGQVAVPGNTAEAVQAAVMAHCEANNRTPFLDAEDVDDADELIEQVGALRSLPGARQAAVFGPWDVVPGTSLGTTRTVPPCARQLGAVAAVDAQTGNPNVPAAGDNGKDSYPIRLSQTYSNADRERLNDAGINVSIIDEGEVTTFGWRTLANSVTQRNWLALSNARLYMSLAAGAKKELKHSLFKQLDAQGETVANAQGGIENRVVKPAFLARALYGATEAEACRVVVEQDVNPTDGSIGKLTATLAARATKFSEVEELTVVATNEAL